MPGIYFSVNGNPVPKQSFRYDGNGHGHTDERVLVWEHQVIIAAREAMRGLEIYRGRVKVELMFGLPDRKKRDVDNLSKGVLDACRKIVFEDDCQVDDLHVVKRVTPDKVGVSVMVMECIEEERQDAK